MPNDHAKLSPSAAHRWMNCPGCINFFAALPESAFKASKYAAEGTVAHSLAEQYVTGKLDLKALTATVGQVVRCDGFNVEIIDAMVEGAIEYLDHINTIKARLTKPGKVYDLTEAKVELTDEVWGTVDKLQAQKGHELHVTDYKFGAGLAVEVDDNEQGMVYLAAARRTVDCDVFDREFFHVCQPRARHSDGTVRTWELPKGRLEVFMMDLDSAVKKTKDPNAARVAGGWCKFCPGLAYCKESAKVMQTAARTAFIDAPTVTQPEMPAVETLTAEQLAVALDWEDRIDSWFKAIRARAQVELTQDAAAVPNYKLVEKKTNRAWGDETEVDTAFAMLGEDRYAPRKIKSPAQMEKLVGKEAVAKYAVKPQGELTIAHVSDKRPTVTIAAQAREAFAEPAVVGADPMLSAALYVTEPPEKKKGPIWPQ